MVKITTSEIEKMILDKMKLKGIPESKISDEQVNKIKETIKTEAAKTRPAQPASTQKEEQPVQQQEKDVVLDVSQDTPTETPGETPQQITTTTETDYELEKVSKKEGELEGREEELKTKEIELQNKEALLQQKEQELSYKPVLPKFMEDIAPEKMFVFDLNELSAGSERLSRIPFHLVSNPDAKTTMGDIWIKYGIKKSEIYLAKFEKVGSIIFNPFAGTSTFEEKRFDVEQPLYKTKEQTATEYQEYINENKITLTAEKSGRSDESTLSWFIEEYLLKLGTDITNELDIVVDGKEGLNLFVSKGATKIISNSLIIKLIIQGEYNNIKVDEDFLVTLSVNLDSDSNTLAAINYKGVIDKYNLSAKHSSVDLDRFKTDVVNNMVNSIELLFKK